MKKAIYRSISKAAVIICIVTLFAGQAFAAPPAAMSLRDFLVQSKNVTGVYPIDDNLTYVVPATGMIASGIKDDFDTEFLAFCRERGALEARFRGPDPITGKENDLWQPLSLDGKGKFANPKTGTVETFSGSMLYGGIAIKGAEPSPVRVKDYMEVIDVVKGDKDSPRAFVVKTKDKQPFTYKIESIPALSRVTIPPDGDLAKNVPEIMNSRKGGFFKTKPQHENDGDIFVYLTALARKHNLTLRYLLNEGEFVPVADATLKYFVNKSWQNGYFKIKLKETTSPFEIFKYMADIGPEKNKFTVWYIWATGEKKFVAKGSEERTVDEKGVVTGKSQVVFANDRGIDGITFTPAGKK
jgi:hypothetical protein